MHRPRRTCGWQFENLKSSLLQSFLSARTRAVSSQMESALAFL